MGCFEDGEGFEGVVMKRILCKDCPHCQPLNEEEGFCEFLHRSKVVLLNQADPECPMMDPQFQRLVRLVGLEEEDE